MVADAGKLGGNAQTLLKNFPDAKIILKKADGKKNYKQISKELNINEKIVSPTLSSAENLGFAEKIKPGVYKKIMANMRYVPNKKKVNEKASSVENIIKKNSKKNKKKLNSTEKTYFFNYQTKVEKMVLAYRWLFITENILRDLIRDVLKNVPNWWGDRIPEGIKQKVEASIQNSKYDDAPRKDNLEYTHLGQLKDIIIYKKNWKDFEAFLKSKDKSNFEHELNKVIPQRNAIGHCIPLIGDDYKYAEMRFKAVLKLLK
ncbi:hypothetical protein KAT80_03295 [Candidatus Pacearchaeota archaeon]|nr:hypothetical protein [Candidatus Pacearchaeota archaeon]